ncbi:MAG: helix-turn-helix transcriptional regulator [Pelobium sp.]
MQTIYIFAVRYGDMKIDFKSALYQIIGSQIKKKRTDLSVSQEDLALKVGLARTSISNIEVGRQQVTISVLYDICHELQIDVHRILPTYIEVLDSLEIKHDYLEILKNADLNHESSERIELILKNLNTNTLL